MQYMQKRFMFKTSEEIRSGLHSKFKIMCSECKMMNIVNSGRITKINNKNYPETNISMALGKSFSDIFTVRNTFHNFLNLYIVGAIHRGTGLSAINKLLTCKYEPRFI